MVVQEVPHKVHQVEEQVTEIMAVAEHLVVQVGTVEAAVVPAVQVQITKVVTEVQEVMVVQMIFQVQV